MGVDELYCQSKIGKSREFYPSRFLPFMSDIKNTLKEFETNVRRLPVLVMRHSGFRESKE